MSTKLNTAHSERLELLPCGAQNFITKGCASAANITELLYFQANSIQ